MLIHKTYHWGIDTSLALNPLLIIFISSLFLHFILKPNDWTHWTQPSPTQSDPIRCMFSPNINLYIYTIISHASDINTHNLRTVYLFHLMSHWVDIYGDAAVVAWPDDSLHFYGCRDGMSGSRFISVSLDLCVCPYGLISLYLSLFNPIQCALFLNTLTHHSKNCFKCEYIYVKIGIPSIAYTIDSHSFIWGTLFFGVYSCYERLSKNICRIAYWNQMLRSWKYSYSKVFLLFLVAAMVCLLYVYNT